MIGPDRLDFRHPAVRRFLGLEGEQSPPEPGVMVDETAPTFGDFAQQTRMSLEEAVELREQLARALVPAAHVAARGFAWLAGVTLDAVLVATDAALAPAVTRQRRIDLLHPAALEFMAARPFQRDRRGEPVIPDGFLQAACVGDEIDLDHPITRVFFTRLEGRVCTDADIDALVK
jgi:hypothetical protein